MDCDEDRYCRDDSGAHHGIGVANRHLGAKLDRSRPEQRKLQAKSDVQQQWLLQRYTRLLPRLGSCTGYIRTLMEVRSPALGVAFRSDGRPRQRLFYTHASAKAI